MRSGRAMSDRIKDLKPVHSQTAARNLGNDQDRQLERRRVWVLRRPAEPLVERRQGERRQGERRQGERRQGERRSQERRQAPRLGPERRVRDRRQGDRRQGERRKGDRRAAAALITTQRVDNPEQAPQPGPRLGTLIDEYA